MQLRVKTHAYWNLSPARTTTHHRRRFPSIVCSSQWVWAEYRLVKCNHWNCSQVSRAKHARHSRVSQLVIISIPICTSCLSIPHRWRTWDFLPMDKTINPKLKKTLQRCSLLHWTLSNTVKCRHNTGNRTVRWWNTAAVVSGSVERVWSGREKRRAEAWDSSFRASLPF